MDRYSVAFSDQAKTAARAMKAAEDTGAHQTPQHSVKISGRKAMPRCESLGDYRAIVPLQRDIDDRCDGKDLLR
jgi:hypothetical protein